MFTTDTKEFGVWRKSHSQRKFWGSSYISPIMIAIGMCAFICWLIFFITLKIVSEFYVLETSGIEIQKAEKFSGVLYPRREVAFRLAARDLNQGKTLLLFETGEKLTFPDQTPLINEFLEKRIRDMEFVGMLTLVANQRISRIEIWPEVGLSSKKLSSLLEYFTKSGFDQFDIAMEAD